MGLLCLIDDKLCQDVSLALTVYLVGLTRKLVLSVLLILSDVFDKSFLMISVYLMRYEQTLVAFANVIL